MKTGINSNGMQRANRNLLIQILLEEKVISRIDLSRKTNLNRATITNIINDFLSFGIVEEEQAFENSRKGSQLRLVCPKGVILSGRLTRTFFKLCAYDIGGELQYEDRMPIDKEADIYHTLALIRERIDCALDRFGKNNILGMCVGVAGPYIRNNRNVAIVTEFEQLSRIDFHKEMVRNYPFFVVTAHDAHLSALAEWKQLDRQTQERERSLIGIQSIGIGIGAGIIVDGKVYQGASGFAGEIGHLGINFNGTAKNPRYRGTFESYASTGTVCNMVAKQLYAFPDTCLNEDSTYQDICRAYKEKDSLAVHVMHDLAWKLAYGLSGIIYTLNPNRIVLMEDYCDDDRFINEIRRNVNEMMGSELLESTSIVHSRIPCDTTILGGYYRVVDEMLKQDLLLDRMRECCDSGEKA